MIPEYNKIDVLNDDKDVIQAKINKLKELRDNGDITEEEYLNERDRVEGSIQKHKLGYAFTW